LSLILNENFFWLRCQDAYELSDDDDEVQEINGANPSSIVGASNDVDAWMLDYDVTVSTDGVNGGDEDDDKEDDDGDDDTLEKNSTTSIDNLDDGNYDFDKIILALWHRILEL